MISSLIYKSNHSLHDEISLCTLQEKLNSRDIEFFKSQHILEYYALVFIIEGEYRHDLDFEIYHLKKGDLFLISPNQIHKFKETSGFEGYVIMFTDNYLRDFFVTHNSMIKYELLRKFYMVKQLTISDYNRSQFISIYNLLLKELNHTPDDNQKVIIQNLFSVVLHCISREFKNENLVSKIVLDNLFIDFMEVLTKNPNYKYNVQYYADKLNISIRSLQNITKKNVNGSPKLLIDMYLILECKRQLLSSKLLIQEIAHNLGFDDPSAFSNYFKKMTKLSPLEFRKNYTVSN